MKTPRFPFGNAFHRTTLACGILLFSTLATTTSARTLHFVSRTEQMTSFDSGGPSRSDVFKHQWTDGATQCLDAFPQTKSVQLGRIDTHQISTKGFRVTGRWICRG
ncbi:hypothetical protein [Xanthomonas campestris]|uniref:hypothetical protein n=1 Tax=Xanthomonas campestris TaxID=339 RepID=UPI001E3E05CC|nr:hypothetical protein [Xanthomonas campestris]MCC4602613.1 hypothetical protein [Xanthomonas campestris pv. parthenii]